MSDQLAISPWWRGLTVDHVYENCPARLRALPELQRCGWHKPVIYTSIRPLDDDVCGICRRRWLARHPTRGVNAAPPARVNSRPRANHGPPNPRSQP